MREYKSYDSNFDVMNQKRHWDSHTRGIVEKRLETDTFYEFHTLNREEAVTLFELCVILLDDRRGHILAYVVHHFDRKLTSDIGEAQRKKGVPKESSLIRDGVYLLDEVCVSLYDHKFDLLEDEKKKKVVNDLMQGNVLLQAGEKSVPAKDFMKKILSETVAAYYSHPDVWSEIGYAGPAYPRGYVRSQTGLTDPWEARRDG
jgi:hypothetical protein